MNMTTVVLSTLAVALAAGGSAAAAGGGPKRDFKRAGQALANSIVLTRSDRPRHLKAWPTGGGFNTPRCSGKPDESDLTLNGRAVSPEFTTSNGVPSINATVLVFQSAAQAQAAFQREMRPTLTRCLTKPLAGLGVQAAAVRLVFDAGPCGNACGTAKRILAAFDLIVLRKGRVEAWLSGVFDANHLRRRLNLEKPLLTKLAARMS